MIVSPVDDHIKTGKQFQGEKKLRASTTIDTHIHSNVQTDSFSTLQKKWKKSKKKKTKMKSHIIDNEKSNLGGATAKQHSPKRNVHVAAASS